MNNDKATNGKVNSEKMSNNQASNLSINLAVKAQANFIFAHGAGADMASDFMEQIAIALQAANINVIRFNFPYMQQRMIDGKKRPPNKAEVLLSAYQAIIDQVQQGEVSGVDKHLPLFVGGKSMGGRMSTLLPSSYSDTLSGIVVFGYPFHPPGKPDKLRTEHLAAFQSKLLILQGERDTFGNESEIQSYSLSNNIILSFLKDGDHSFKPRKASGLTLEHNIQQAVERTIKFIKADLPE
ncbi:alpha/beta family hydrolase [Flocculibacter collagenilyticus]|uniref:alpha/beta family hydrolase n=1 Tax=Flocculibacter collagenilyticus TaxID=2744479 RepID=UPI001F1F009A|nr:alpha/beta family hydrolase [Flocculibacter collagenilyticus]